MGGALLCPTAAEAGHDAKASLLLSLYETGTAETRNVITETVLNVENGFAWANAILRNRADRPAPLYCPPQRMAFTGDQLMDILRRFVNDRPDMAERPGGLVLMLAMEDAFPCP